MILNKKVKLEGSRRERIILALEMAGWYKDRSIDITESENYYKACGVELLESGQRFLREFRGLADKWYINTDYRPNYGEDFVFSTEPHSSHLTVKDHMYDDADYKVLSEKYINIQGVAKEAFVYVGEIGYYYPAEVWIGESGRIYATHEYDNNIHTFESVFDLIEWELSKYTFDCIEVRKSH
jgi:hypothetical protein